MNNLVSDGLENSFGSGFITGTKKHGSGLNSGLLFANIHPHNDPHISFSKQRGRLNDKNIRELCDGLDRLTSEKVYPTTVATFSQNGGEWYASGLSKIHDALVNIDERWSNKPDWDKHKREMVTICADVDDDTTIFIGGQAAPAGNSDESVDIKSPWMAVETDGIPITGDEIETYSDHLGWNAPRRCIPVEKPEINVFDTTIKQSMDSEFGKDIISERYTYSEHPEDDEWVIAVCIENPFNRNGLSRLFEQKDVAFGDEVIDHILSRDRIIAVMGSTHPIGDDEIIGYEISRLRLQDHTESLDGRSGKMYNLYIQLEYLS